MPKRIHPLERKGGVLIHPPPISPPISAFPREASSSSESKIDPAVLLVIVILAIIFFICGLLHLLVRFLMKRPSFYSFSTSRRYPDSSGSDALQRQLQQLFRLHDSGLDQAIIDALPVFCYKEIVGLNEPFDCAVCLCEFSDQDQLRLLPVCSHAFHVSCIDTWLLSNSTCPLCRGTLDNQLLSLDHYTGLSNDSGSTHSNQRKPAIMEEPAGERRLYSVMLGKFRSVNNEPAEEISNGETRNGNLDARRCFSMGSCEYVIDESGLLVSLCDGLEGNGSKRGSSMKIEKASGNSWGDGDAEAMRISCSSKGESFSVSKIWQWSKRGKVPSSSDANVISV